MTSNGLARWLGARTWRSPQRRCDSSFARCAGTVPHQGGFGRPPCASGRRSAGRRAFRAPDRVHPHIPTKLGWGSAGAAQAWERAINDGTAMPWTRSAFETSPRPRRTLAQCCVGRGGMFVRYHRSQRAAPSGVALFRAVAGIQPPTQNQPSDLGSSAPPFCLFNDSQPVLDSELVLGRLALPSQLRDPTRISGSDLQVSPLWSCHLPPPIR